MTSDRHPPHPDTITERIHELQLLWPALPAALPRDTGTSHGERVRVSENVHSIPINPQVAATIRRLAPHIPDLPTLNQAYSDAWTNRRWADAYTIAHHITGWLDDARNALGLNRPDQPVGAHCPHHDQPLTPLVTPGDRGELLYEQVAADGSLVGGRIWWRKTFVIVCRHCEAEWPPLRHLFLKRLIDDADQRRASTGAANQEDLSEQDPYD